MIKSYKIRLYPTKEQERIMWRHIGSCRYIWNWMLSKQEELYKAGEKHLSAFSMINLLKPLKNDGEHGWLYEVSNASCQVVCSDLDKAYQGFFKKTAGFPKFKSRRRSKANYPVKGETLWFSAQTAHIPKVGKVKYKTDFVLPQGAGHKFSNARISNVNGKWMLSFGAERENQTRILTDKPMGIDLGVKDTMIVAYGDEKLVFPNINKGKAIRTIKRRIKSLQRSISRKYEANKRGNEFTRTRNIEKLENKMRKLYARLSGIRINYIHQSTHNLIELLPSKVAMEDLNVQGMMKNRHLSKAIQEQCFYEIIRQMKYKCEWNGIPFFQVGRFYPSSKLCHSCGCIKQNLKLSDRIYTCENCGYTEDRDFNAALNLSRYEA